MQEVGGVVEVSVRRFAVLDDGVSGGVAMLGVSDEVDFESALKRKKVAAVGCYWEGRWYQGMTCCFQLQGSRFNGTAWLIQITLSQGGHLMYKLPILTQKT